MLKNSYFENTRVKITKNLDFSNMMFFKIIYMLIMRFAHRSHEAQGLLGNLCKLACINVGSPHPTLVWSPPSLEPATQQRLFAY